MTGTVGCRLIHYWWDGRWQVNAKLTVGGL
jgi:hypothetical protein